MQKEHILQAVKSIKMKNSEGNNGIPQRVLIDGISKLISSLTILFDSVYKKKTVLEQWKLAKITDMSNLRIGKNILTNRLVVLNNEIDYNWLNLTLTGFKLKCKNLYLTIFLLSALLR